MAGMSMWIHQKDSCGDVYVKENKVVDILNIKTHVTTISIHKLALNESIINSLVEDEHYIQLKARIQQEKLQRTIKAIS